MIRDELVLRHARHRDGETLPPQPTRPRRSTRRARGSPCARERSRRAPEIPPRGWAYVDARRIRLLPEGTKPEPGALYEFHYPAKDPKVLGHRARRDARHRLVPALRERATEPGTANPARRAGSRSTCSRSAARRAGAICATTSRRASTRTRAKRKVFDGVLAHTPGVGARVPQRGVRAAGPHQHPARGPHLSGERVSVLRGAHERPGDRPERRAVPQRRLRSAADRNQHLDRVLAEGRLAARSPIRSGTRDVALPPKARAY